MREVPQNNASTTLAGSIDPSQTTITVTSGLVFPSTGQFRLIIGGELLLCTGRVGNDLTVQRGVEGSTAASHSSGATVSHILTAAALQQFRRDDDPLAGVRPPLQLELSAADFAWVNQDDGASRADQHGTIVLRKPAQAGDSNSLLVRDVAGPFTVMAAFQAVAVPDDNANVYFGLCVRESSTGKLILFANNIKFDEMPRISVYRYSSPTSSFANYLDRRHCFVSGPLFQRITDDGTDLKLYVGDGVEWVEVFSVNRTDYLSGGPDQVGFFLGNFENSNEAVLRLIHWSVE